MQLNNTVVIAAAGSGKTTSIVEDALSNPDAKILILTYTIFNLHQIKKTFISIAGLIPLNITIMSWYTFLLHDGVRPYQNVLYDEKRVESIFFSQGVSTQYIPKSDVSRFYFHEGKFIYTDKISQFVVTCNELSKGLVINRLELIFDQIYIDEIQDLAGYDFDFLEILFYSKIKIKVVGDIRQATYFTNCSPKNKKFKGKNIYDLFSSWRKNGLCNIDVSDRCYRCNQEICDFADKIYPELPKTISENKDQTDHDGIYQISTDQVYDYVDKYSPAILRHNVKTNTMGLRALNFGLSKGLSFKRVLIFPSEPIRQYLINGDVKKLKDKTKANLYVSITRSYQSVAFVLSDHSCFTNIKKYTS